MDWIYIMGNTRYIARYKIGISNNVKNRRKNIDDSVKGSVYVIFAAPIFFAYFWEQALHGIYSPLSAKMEGSGKTEWFWLFAPITPVLFVTAIFLGQFVAIFGMAFYLWNLSFPINQTQIPQKQVSYEGHEKRKHRGR